MWLAAELAAKKTRVKQSLIKRARSVAIFSLKLKERRAREAEKQAFNLAEQEKVNRRAFSFVSALEKNTNYSVFFLSKAEPST